MNKSRISPILISSIFILCSCKALNPAFMDPKETDSSDSEDSETSDSSETSGVSETSEDDTTFGTTNHSTDDTTTSNSDDDDDDDDDDSTSNSSTTSLGDCSSFCSELDPNLSIGCDEETCSFFLKKPKTIAVYCQRDDPENLVVNGLSYTCPDYGQNIKEESQGCGLDDANFLCRFLTKNPKYEIDTNKFIVTDAVKEVGEMGDGFHPGFGCSIPLENVDFQVESAKVDLTDSGVTFFGNWYENVMNPPNDGINDHPVHQVGNKIFVLVVSEDDCVLGDED